MVFYPFVLSLISESSLTNINADLKALVIWSEILTFELDPVSINVFSQHLQACVHSFYETKEYIKNMLSWLFD